MVVDSYGLIFAKWIDLPRKGMSIYPCDGFQRKWSTAVDSRLAHPGADISMGQQSPSPMVGAI